MRGKRRDGAVEAGCGLLVFAECGEGACAGGVDMGGVEPGAPNAVGVRATEEGECGVVGPAGFVAFTRHGVGMGLVQDGDHFETTSGPGGAPGGGGEAEGVGGMSGVDRELCLAPEDVRGEVGVSGGVGGVECLRGMAAGGALIAYVLGEPARQFFVSRLQGEESDGVGATGRSASYGEGDEVLLEGGQHVPGADQVVCLDHHPAELREVLEGDPKSASSVAAVAVVAGTAVAARPASPEARTTRRGTRARRGSFRGCGRGRRPCLRRLRQSLPARARSRPVFPGHWPHSPVYWPHDQSSWPWTRHRSRPGEPRAPPRPSSEPGRRRRRAPRRGRRLRAGGRDAQHARSAP